MKAAWALSILFLLTLITSCSSSADDPSYPIYSWGHFDGQCGFSRTIDAQGTLENALVCASGDPQITQLGQLSTLELRRLSDAFASLPAPADVTDCPALSQQTFAEQTAADAYTIWKACADNEALYSTEGLKEPYLSVAQFFLE